MKLLAVNGSPRTGGNTSTILKDIVRMAESAGVETSYFDLASLEIRDCKACMSCRREDCCSQQDDMEKISPLLAEADILVLGSPVYMGDQTGLMKCFVDRLYRFMVPDAKGVMRSRLPPGKKALVIFTCQMPNGDRVYNYITIRYFNLLVNNLGYEDIRTFIIGGASPSQDLRQTPQAKVALEECARFVTGM